MIRDFEGEDVMDGVCCDLENGNDGDGEIMGDEEDGKDE